MHTFTYITLNARTSFRFIRRTAKKPLHQEPFLKVISSAAVATCRPCQEYKPWRHESLADQLVIIYAQQQISEIIIYIYIIHLAVGCNLSSPAHGIDHRYNKPYYIYGIDKPVISAVYTAGLSGSTPGA